MRQLLDWDDLAKIIRPYKEFKNISVTSNAMSVQEGWASDWNKITSSIPTGGNFILLIFFCLSLIKALNTTIANFV